MGIFANTPSRLASDVVDPKAARLTFGLIGAAVVGLTAVGGVLVGLVALLALLGTPLFAVMGGVSELAWLTDSDPSQQLLRRLAPAVPQHHRRGRRRAAAQPHATDLLRVVRRQQ